MGHGTLCAGNAVGAVSTWGSGRLSCIPVEVRCDMLVLITYDVNTENATGKRDYAKWQNNALIMAEEFRILCLNVFWIMLRALH